MPEEVGVTVEANAYTCGICGIGAKLIPKLCEECAKLLAQFGGKRVVCFEHRKFHLLRDLEACRKAKKKGAAQTAQSNQTGQ